MCRETLEAHLETVPEDLQEAFLDSFIRFNVDFEEPAARLREHAGLHLTQHEARLLKALSFPIGFPVPEDRIATIVDCSTKSSAVRSRVTSLRKKVAPLGLERAGPVVGDVTCSIGRRSVRQKIPEN